MATVSDSSIMMAAQEITSDFIDGKVTLNEGVAKKASDLGYNVEQTKRLIERTNTEAFMKKFATGESEFTLADPDVILGDKNVKTASTYTLSNTEDSNSEGMFKAASEEKKEYIPSNHGFNLGASKEYQEKLASVDLRDIFGLNDDDMKVDALPSAIDPDIANWNRMICESTKTASERQVEYDAKAFAFYDKVDELAEFIKQASLSGDQSIRDSELELLNMFPENVDTVRNLYDNIVEKMASEGVNPSTLERSVEVPVSKLAHESKLTRLFEDLIDIANK